MNTNEGDRWLSKVTFRKVVVCPTWGAVRLFHHHRPYRYEHSALDVEGDRVRSPRK